ncbi:MAG: hypothetical protein AAF460_03480 [Pseudomonadota bacterium]
MTTLDRSERPIFRLLKRRGLGCLALLMLVVPAVSPAQIVKCIGAQARVTFMEPPCPRQAQDATPKRIRSLTLHDSHVSATRSDVGDKASPGFTGERISALQYDAIHLQSLLQLLADFGGKRITFNGEAAMIKDVNYTDAPWDQVLHDLSKKHKFKYKAATTIEVWF